MWTLPRIGAFIKHLANYYRTFIVESTELTETRCPSISNCCRIPIRDTMEPFEHRPSISTEDFYIRAARRTGRYPQHTDNGGKWLIFVPISAVEWVSDNITPATQ